MLAELEKDPKIPTEIYQIAERQHVGMPVKCYRPQYMILQRIAVPILCCMMLLDTVWMLWLIFSAGTPYNIWITSLSGLTSLILPFCIYSQTRLRFYICTEGLLSIDGKKQEAIRWDEIKEYYWNGSVVQTLVRNDGSRFTIARDLKNGSEISDLVEEEVMASKLSTVRAQYRRGETVEFGNLQVNQYGIVDLDDAVTWEQLEDIRLEKDVLSLKYEGKWHTWYGRFSLKIYSPRYAYPPNLPIFVALVQEILEKKFLITEEGK